ncbi:MAG: hypothetical protein HXO68_02055 [Rothia sp.]|uniref:hypothetical protein n=1 Tax=Rothia sp. (in: high G+C Gram-positive bacteria) TaxID=1885016 RepID=UPI001CAAFC93|nr:hypothetical protein [Rothia sp. (in: high G+C Gram-positive bacteria)]MBF1675914.1 hypothetical protein [Rothia sp. (in: high G+C Gram-positive bacteria)]
MLDTIFSIFWGIILVLSILSIPYIIIRYEINRHQDKKKEEQGIYIRRVNRFEVWICIINPFIPFLLYMANSHSGNMGIWFNIAGIALASFFFLCSRYILVAYVKLSPEGIEQRVWSANPTRYPINAIDSIVYYETLNVEDQEMVGLYTRSGKQIAAFGPTTHNNYRILAIVRFRIENERWPDMNNLDDVAKVNELDDRGMTILYFRGREKVTDLADVDM